ncbi:ribonuclease E inhibitor RraB [Aurantivibrio infirmus]
MTWPNNADGDVFRRLESDNFDFSMEYEIDFNIDFEHWPLSTNECEHIVGLYPNAEIIDPDEEDLEEGIDVGYVLIKIRNELQYEFIINTQQLLTEQMSNIGGVCESWGVLHG